MAFMLKKKRFKFQVEFELEELSSVPFVSGVLFAKVRLLDGGNFTDNSKRVEVVDHCVRWRTKFSFACKLVASATSGVLEPCVCRVSVRKELKGGKSYQKLGFADINLAEYAGCGITSRRYLLEGYDSKRRQDNSMLKVNIDMSLLCGDPCFKAPHPQTLAMTGSGEDDLQLENKGAAAGGDRDSVASGSSGFGSLPRKNRTSRLSTDSSENLAGLGDVGGAEGGVGIGSVATDSEVFERGHVRNSSSQSQHSEASAGYSSMHRADTHSRQGSYGSDGTHPASHARFLGTSRNSKSSLMSSSSLSPSTGSSDIMRHKKLEAMNSKERRVGSTRVDADDIVEELLTDFHIDESAETSGLQLFVAKDGTTVLGGQRGPPGSFEKVVIEHR